MSFPYVGVTDVPRADFVLRILDLFKDDLLRIGRVFAPGVMMSRKTLHGLPTKWASVFLPNDRIASAFVPHPLAMNVLHYADYDPTDPEDVVRDLSQAVFWGGDHLRALQLDMVWPHPQSLKAFLGERLRPIEIILQVSPRALEKVPTPELLALRLAEYEGLVSYILIDPSMGRGVGMNPEESLRTARIVRSALPSVQIVFAGGLSADTVSLLQPFFAEFPSLSVDAQAGLRPTRNALDPLDWDMTARYIEAMIAVVARAGS